MLRAKHFSNTEIHEYYTDFGICMMNSADSIAHLDTYAQGIYNLGILNSKPPRIIINYYHLDKINANATLEPTPHHVGSFKGTHDGSDKWELICEHEIVVHYPEICLVRKLHGLGNRVVRKAMAEFIRTHKYWDIKALDFDDATWLMANILGQNE